MPEAACRVLTLLCALAVPVGTHLGLLYLLWLLVSGQLLATRGGVPRLERVRPAPRRAPVRLWGRGWCSRLLEERCKIVAPALEQRRGLHTGEHVALIVAYQRRSRRFLRGRQPLALPLEVNSPLPRL